MQKGLSQNKNPAQNKPQKIQRAVNQISLYFGNVRKVLVSFSKNNINNKEYDNIRKNI